MNFFANNSGKKFEENYKIKKVLGKGRFHTNCKHFFRVTCRGETVLTSLNQNGKTSQDIRKITLKRKECSVKLPKRSRTHEETGSSQYCEAFGSIRGP